jgi:hypothetical protein
MCTADECDEVLLAFKCCGKPYHKSCYEGTVKGAFEKAQLKYTNELLNLKSGFPDIHKEERLKAHA